MTTGRRPFGGQGSTLGTIFNEIIQSTPPEPASFPAPVDVSPALSRVVMKCLCKDPSDRYQAGKDLAAALRGVLRPSLGAARLEQLGPRSAHLLLLILFVFALFSGGIYFFTTSRVSTPPSPSSGEKTSSIPAERVGPPAEEDRPNRPPISIEKVGEEHSGEPAERTLEPLREKHTEVVEAEHPKASIVETGTKAHEQAIRSDHKPQETFAAIPEPRTSPPPPEKKSLSAPAASLRVESSPSGARVYITGVLKGKTPLAVLLPLGNHHLRIAAEGFQRLGVENGFERGPGISNQHLA
jgi:serine/threonine protein kinase